jgi:multiple antibiotic resistance protein
MFAVAALTLKNTITLFALVGPVSMIPIFVAATDGLDDAARIRFARTIAVSVVVALLVAAFLGMPLFGLLGVSLGAMVLGKETTFKGYPPVTEERRAREASIVPLAIPLLAGPAAFSYVMGNSAWNSPVDLVHIVLPILLVGFGCWVSFRVACRAELQIRRSTLDLVERVGGFILAAMAVEMMATGLRALFPILTPAA